MVWTLQVVASLPITTDDILLPWTFTSTEVALIINPTVPLPSKYIHGGWLKQLVSFPDFPKSLARKFLRMPLGYSFLEFNNSYPYELSFKCFQYLGQLEIIAYENI